MPVEGIHTAMTTLQFSRTLSMSRAVETSGGASSSRGRSTGVHQPGRSGQTHVTRSAANLVSPPALHWTYRPVPGKVAAKRVPQLAAGDNWSCSLNRVG